MSRAAAPTEPALPAWTRIADEVHFARPDASTGLGQMIAGYEREAREWFADYLELEQQRASRSLSPKKYEALKAAFDRYKAMLVPIRELLIMAVQLAPAQRAPKPKPKAQKAAAA